MFRHVIKDPVPGSVTDLQGVGDTWQGYSLYIRFVASEADIEAVISQGFTSVAWEDIAHRYSLPEGYDVFEPPWSPETVPSKECYELSEVKNGWTHSGTHYLVIDRARGLVYFYGIGA